jgi:hypothetical protein
MASINLAGTIGLGGKRESIISGLPDAINKAGDALNKTIGDELRRQEVERAAKKEKELQIKEQLSKQVRSTIGEGEMSDPDKARINERGLDAMSKAYSVYTDPNISWAEKENIKNKLFSDLEKEAMFYRKDYEDFKNTMGFMNKNKDVIDFNKVDEFVKGDIGVKEETIQTTDDQGNAISKQVITPKQQGTPYFDIPYEERVKIAPNNFGEAASKLVHVKAGDEIKAVEDFIRAKPSAFVTETTTDGTNKFTIKQDEIAKERTLLKAGMEDPSTLPLETFKLFNNFYDRRYKEFAQRNFPKEQAMKAAKELASQDMLTNFDKVINRGIEEATNKPKINNEGGGQAPTSLTSNDKWTIADPIPVDKMENTLTEQQIGDIETKVLNEFPDPKEKAYNQTPEQYQAYLTELKSNREKIVEKRKAEETKKMFGGKDVAYVSVQSVGTSQNPTQPFAIGKGIADGVYIDQKTNEILGFGVSTIESDGSKGEFSFERATPEKVIDYKTNLGVVKGTGKNLWESKYPKKSVSSQSGSEKDYGTRRDGTQKGTGYFGELKMKDGSNKVATEITISPKVNGKTMDIPSLVPTLTNQEKDWLLTNGMKGDDVWEQPIAKSIEKKAIAHAEKRIKEGKSVFADGEKKAEAKKGVYKSKGGITFEVK